MLLQALGSSEAVHTLIVMVGCAIKSPLPSLLLFFLGVQRSFKPEAGRTVDKATIKNIGPFSSALAIAWDATAPGSLVFYTVYSTDQRQGIKR